MNKLIVPNAEFAIQQLKTEIAAELGVQLGADTTARDCGRVGGEVTKRLIELGKMQLVESINAPTITHNMDNPPEMLH